MLLLDEPTNHLDAETIAWLQQHLIEYKGTILIVTHDRYFLDDITGWILELDRGRGIPYEGNYSAWLEQKAKRLEQEAREDKSKQRTLERELRSLRHDVIPAPPGLAAAVIDRLPRQDSLLPRRVLVIQRVARQVTAAAVAAATGVAVTFGLLRRRKRLVVSH
jgi:ABC-type multidrug transport system ATPase subunit